LLFDFTYVSDFKILSHEEIERGWGLRPDRGYGGRAVLQQSKTEVGTVLRGFVEEERWKFEYEGPLKKFIKQWILQYKSWRMFGFLLSIKGQNFKAIKESRMEWTHRNLMVDKRSLFVGRTCMIYFRGGQLFWLCGPH